MRLETRLDRRWTLGKQDAMQGRPPRPGSMRGYEQWAYDAGYREGVKIVQQMAAAVAKAASR